MKINTIEPKPQFKPITITLETQEEVDAMWLALNTVTDQHRNGRTETIFPPQLDGLIEKILPNRSYDLLQVKLDLRDKFAQFASVPKTLLRKTVQHCRDLV